MADESTRMSNYLAEDIVDNIEEVRTARGTYESLDARLDDIEGGGPSPSNPIASNCVSPMTGYSKSSSSTPGNISTGDTLNAAIGKLEKRTELNENNISLLSPTDYSTPTVSSNITLRSGGYCKIGNVAMLCVRINISEALAYGDAIFTGLPLPVSNTSLSLNTKVVYAANDSGVNIGITREGNLVAQEAIPVSAITINCTYLATQ
jgi:hypothetical protein